MIFFLSQLISMINNENHSKEAFVLFFFISDIRVLVTISQACCVNIQKIFLANGNMFFLQFGNLMPKHSSYIPSAHLPQRTDNCLTTVGLWNSSATTVPRTTQSQTDLFVA